MISFMRTGWDQMMRRMSLSYWHLCGQLAGHMWYF